MIKTVLLDSCFLIGLVSKDDRLHVNANVYWKYFLDNDVKMYLSTIVASEFATKHNLSDFPLNKTIPMLFNIRDAEMAGQISKFRQSKHSSKPEDGASRIQLKDDFKILAQLCGSLVVEAIVTGDGKMRGPFNDAIECHSIKKKFIDINNPITQELGLPLSLFDKSDSAKP